MPRRKSPKPPSYRLHKARGLAIVTIDGHDHYLGKFGSAESHERYAQLIAVWRQRQAVPQPKPVIGTLAVAELTLVYWQHAKLYLWPRMANPTGVRPSSGLRYVQ